MKKGGGDIALSKNQSILAVAAHPDDIEFNMAGTLSLLAKAGFVPHMMNLSRSSLDSNELAEPEVAKMRRQEAERSAAVIDAIYHPPIADDLLILYDERLLRQMVAVVREIRPGWLALSATVRKWRVERFLHWLPGVSKDPDRSDTFIVDRRLARWFALRLFHLLGFRREGKDGPILVMTRRRDFET